MTGSAHTTCIAAWFLRGSARTSPSLGGSGLSERVIVAEAASRIHGSGVKTWQRSNSIVGTRSGIGCAFNIAIFPTGARLLS